ncbi:MAG TPA: AsmA-like C-terminal region-containing protein, partial [Candidatus Kryptonia bacterium]|nr:AsmA-like C-terminal region-containing protein [Candidatus Kryptonia bacterium]
ALGRPVDLASISIALIPMPTVRLGGVTIADDPDFGAAPFVSVPQAEVVFRLEALLHRRVQVSSVRLQQPEIVIRKRAGGETGRSDAGEQPSAVGRSSGTSVIDDLAELVGATVEIHQGAFRYVRQAADGSESEYRVDQLDGRATVAPVAAVEADGRLQPGDVALHLTEGTLALADAEQLTAAPVQARVALDGADATALLTQLLGSVVGGGLKGTLKLTGTLANPAAAGDVEFTPALITRTNSQCPPPQRRTLSIASLSGTASWRDGRLIVDPTTAQLGDGFVTGRLTVDGGRGVRIDLRDLEAAAVPLAPLLVEFLCGGYAVTGPLDLTGALSLHAPAATGGLTGFGQFRIGSGQVVGPRALALLSAMVRVGGAVSALLSADFPWALFSSPLDFDSISGSYEISNGVVRLRDLQYNSWAMKIAGEGDYDLAAANLAFEMEVKHGRGEAAVRVTGPADSPSVHVSPATVFDKVPGLVEHEAQRLFGQLHE